MQTAWCRVCVGGAEGGMLRHRAVGCRLGAVGVVMVVMELSHGTLLGLLGLLRLEVRTLPLTLIATLA